MRGMSTFPSPHQRIEIINKIQWFSAHTEMGDMVRDLAVLCGISRLTFKHFGAQQTAADERRTVQLRNLPTLRAGRRREHRLPAKGEFYITGGGPGAKR